MRRRGELERERFQPLVARVVHDRPVGIERTHDATECAQRVRGGEHDGRLMGRGCVREKVSEVGAVIAVGVTHHDRPNVGVDGEISKRTEGAESAVENYRRVAALKEIARTRLLQFGVKRRSRTSENGERNRFAISGAVSFSAARRSPR